MEEKLHLRITYLKKKKNIIDMQKAADKRPEQPELPENLCVICFSNVLELWSSSFLLANNDFFFFMPTRRNWSTTCRFQEE